MSNTKLEEAARTLASAWTEFEAASAKWDKAQAPYEAFLDRTGWGDPKTVHEALELAAVKAPFDQADDEYWAASRKFDAAFDRWEKLFHAQNPTIAQKHQKGGSDMSISELQEADAAYNSAFAELIAAQGKLDDARAPYKAFRERTGFAYPKTAHEVLELAAVKAPFDQADAEWQAAINKFADAAERQDALRGAVTCP